MEFTLAFGAVGDFIAVLELIKNLVAALDDSRGSKKEFRDVVQRLKILESTLKQVEEVYRDQELRDELRILVLRKVQQLKRCLEGFCDKMKKFGPSLANCGTNNVLRDAARKVQWKLGQKEIEMFLGELLGHTTSMNTLLELTTLTVIRQTHESTVKTIFDSEKRTTAVIQDVNQSLKAYVGVVAQRVLSRLEYVSSLGIDLKSSISQILSVVFAISEELNRIGTAIMRLERPFSDEYFVFEDAAGRLFPIHLRTITSWKVFEFIIVDRFKGKKGSHRIRKGRYTLQERATGREIDRSLDWESAFLPYQRVSMSLMCRDARGTMNGTTSASCPKCGTTSPKESGVEAQCQTCNIFFKRVLEVDHEANSKVFKRSKSFKDKDRTVESYEPRKGRHRNNPMTGVLQEESDSDSDDEDFRGFVRIILISRLFHKWHFPEQSRDDTSEASRRPTASGLGFEIKESSSGIRRRRLGTKIYFGVV